MTYDPYKCEAFTHNMDAPFTVLSGGAHHLVLDLAACDGQVSNYQVTLFNDSRKQPVSKLIVLDTYSGMPVGTPSPHGDIVLIGHVPANAMYTIIVQNGGKKSERCVLYFSGAIGGQP